MTNQRVFAYVLIVIGAIALLSRLADGAGWLWIGLVSIGFLVAYVRERTYSFLVVGGILSGIAVGILLEGSWNWEGAFLISLGIGFAAIDRVEPRRSRWPLFVGAALAALGLVVGLISSGVLGSPWFALLLIAAGVWLLRRRSRPAGDAPGADPRGDGWVRPAEPAAPREAQATVPAGAARPAAAADRERTPGGVAGEPDSELNVALRDELRLEGDDARDPDVAGSAATREAPDAPAPAASAGESPAPAPSAGESPAGVDARRRALRDWRARQAEREERAEGMVLPDDTLERVADADPRTPEQLGEVRGVGPVTLERYGSALLETLASVRR